MELSWQSLAKLYAPILLLAGINIVLGLYNVGYRAGQKSMLEAARDAAIEAKHG